MRDNLLVKSIKIFVLIFIVLIGKNLSGQIDFAKYEKDFGKGEITIKKKIIISFLFNKADGTYRAKVTHRYDKLYIGNRNYKGFVQIPFNMYQDINIKNARYFKFDSAGTKKLIENVKVKYVDIKDYYIQNIFYSDLKVKQFNCSVDLPENYFLRYSYDVIYKDLKFLSSFYFQSSLEAVEDVEIEIMKNENVSLSVYDFNLDGIVKTENESSIKYKAKNLKRFKPSSKSVKGSYYLPHIIISVNSTKTKEKTTEILKSTSHLYAWYNTLIGELSPDTTYINNLAKSIVGNSTNDVEKINKIFKWVQNNIQYVAFEDGIAGFKPAEAHEVAKVKYGDCKGMANLLVKLLKSEGFDARHAWIGTRSNNYSYDLPSLVVDNHMICGLNYNGKTYYLDATSKSALWNISPPHLEGKEVMLANNDSYIINKIEKSSPEHNKLSITGSIDLKDSQPTVKFNVELTGHFKSDFLSYLAYLSLKSKKDLPFYFMSTYLNGVNVENISEPVITDEKISFTLSGYYMNIARGATTTLFPFLDLLEFDQVAEDNPPLYVDYPQIITLKLELKNADKQPKESYSNNKIGNDDFFANYYIENVGDKIYLNQKLHLNILHTPIESQEEWNMFVSQVKSFINTPLSYE